MLYLARRLETWKWVVNFASIRIHREDIISRNHFWKIIAHLKDKEITQEGFSISAIQKWQEDGPQVKYSSPKKWCQCVKQKTVDCIYRYLRVLLESFSIIVILVTAAGDEEEECGGHEI